MGYDMQSYYEINVSLNGRHLFATAPRSITSAVKASTMLALLHDRFPSHVGYSINCTHWEMIGKPFAAQDDGSGA
ncbi:hypothetical protein KTD26_20555 [Burkholderia multivorans]|uniref:hypothetical protein n=1 Tax=Burkholderia multivorans TaxID=87883 RepID=UPI001C2474F2|nr:hypothetical protein [Burkholderia multivorans]MBU9144913.1 hypothetical protein [Burkholderia multivorans]MBU9537160.1 hypothetical protein [Burkholderia multivorans]